MSNKFTKALEFTLPWEVGAKLGTEKFKRGGINYHDGALTKWGLFQKYHPWLTEDTTLDEALAVYKQQYWDVYGLRPYYINMDLCYLPLAVTLFDSGVNCGVPTAAKWYSIAAKEKEPTKHLLALRKDYYVGLLSSKVPQVKARAEKSFNGWINRLNDLRKFVEILSQKEP